MESKGGEACVVGKEKKNAHSVRLLGVERPPLGDQEVEFVCPLAPTRKLRRALQVVKAVRVELVREQGRDRQLGSARQQPRDGDGAAAPAAAPAAGTAAAAALRRRDHRREPAPPGGVPAGPAVSKLVHHDGHRQVGVGEREHLVEEVGDARGPKDGDRGRREAPSSGSASASAAAAVCLRGRALDDARRRGDAEHPGEAEGSAAEPARDEEGGDAAVADWGRRHGGAVAAAAAAPVSVAAVPSSAVSSALSRVRGRRDGDLPDQRALRVVAAVEQPRSVRRPHGDARRAAAPRRGRPGPRAQEEELEASAVGDDALVGEVAEGGLGGGHGGGRRRRGRGCCGVVGVGGGSGEVVMGG